MDELDIAEVHRRTGLPPSTLRHYEACGLIRPSGRHGLRRQYTTDVIDRLAMVQAAQAAGFTLADAAELLEASSSEPEVRRRLTDKADELDRRIDLLTAVRDQLRHAADCRSPRLIECPHFRRCIHSTPPGRTPPGVHQAPPIPPDVARS